MVGGGGGESWSDGVQSIFYFGLVGCGHQYRGCFTVVESTVLVKGKTWLRFTPRLTGKGQ